MRINEIFKGMSTSNLDTAERVAVQHMLRYILAERRNLGIENDVCALFDFKGQIAQELGLDTDVLNLVWRLPSVEAHLRNHGYNVASKPARNVTEVEETAFESSEEEESGETMVEKGDESESSSSAADKLAWALEDVQASVSAMHANMQCMQTGIVYGVYLMNMLTVITVCIGISTGALLAKHEDTIRDGAVSVFNTCGAFVKSHTAVVFDFAKNIVGAFFKP